MRILLVAALSAFVFSMACKTTVRSGDVVLEPLASFSGRVQDRATSQGLGGVSVRTSPEGGFATTNAQGEYVLLGGLAPGRAYRLEFARSGYAPVALDNVGASSAGDARVVDVEMDRTHAIMGVLGGNVLLGATANEASFSIANVGDHGDVLSYSLSTTAPWLTITPQTGDVLDEAAIITVRADRLLLGTNWGVYSATIDVVSNAGTDTVSVRLIHEPQELGVITVDQTLLDYGQVDHARTIRFDNPGGEPVHWEIVALPSYLTPAAVSGTVGTGNFLLLEFLLDRGALLPGTYVGEVRVNTDSEIQPQLVVAVRFEVVPRISVSTTTSFLDLGADLSTKAFGLVNDGNVGFDYEILLPPPWDAGDPRTCSQRPRITTVPRSGVLAPGGTASIGVKLDRTGLLPGDVTKPISVVIKRDGVEVEQRTVTVRYVAAPRAAIATTLDEPALTPLNGTANLRVLLTSPTLDACDMLTNVPIQWSATVSQPWFNVTEAGGVLEMPVVPGGVVDGTAAPIGYMHLEVDWTKVPRVAGTYPITLAVDWCTPTLGLPMSCNAAHQRVNLSLTITQPGPQIEKLATWVQPEIAGFSSATVAAFNPFTTHVLMGPSFIGYLNAGAYWLEWDLTPGEETGYRMTAGTLPTSWSPSDTPIDQRGLPGDSSLVYDWVHDAYVFVWTFYASGVPSTYTWLYENAGWRMVTPMSAGIPRIRKTNLTYDTKRGRVLMYGGYIDELTPDDTLREFDFETGEWNVLTTALIGAELDVTRAAIVYDATQDRYIVHGGKPLTTLSGHNVSAVDRTWAVAPDTLAVTRITPDATYPSTERWGGRLVHNVEQNITYSYGGCFQTGPSSPYEACYDAPLRVLLNPGAHPQPIPPLAEAMLSGSTDGRYSPGIYHLTYDSNFDRMLFTGTGAAPDPVTGLELSGARAWQLIYNRAFPPAPTITLSTTSMQVIAGSPGNFTIANNSGTIAVYRVKPIERWLSVDQTAGYLANGTVLPVTVTPAPGLSQGTHRGRIRVEGAAKQSFEIQVEVTVP